MASVTKYADGRRTIQFVGVDGRRRSIRLGRVSDGDAEVVKGYVQELALAARTGRPLHPSTSAWVHALAPVLYDRLARVGLVPRRAPVATKADVAMLGTFLGEYVEKRSDVKPATQITYGNVRRNLTDYFKADKPLSAILPGDVDEWRLWLATEEDLAENTIRRRVAIARQFFRRAVRKGLIPSNPFDDQRGVSVRENRARMYFVTQDEAKKVLEACPDAEWRLIFVLCRFAGLRCPSEVLGLRWGDVDWERGRITVHSPKTAHHDGHDLRVIPLFPELVPHLQAVFDQAEPGTEFAITRYRDTRVNLRTQFNRIVKRAGLAPWPKLFQNLRSTRETELSDGYPLHVICQWMGNSRPVAARHYLQVTDEHFARATRALQKAVQCEGVPEGTEQEPKPAVTGDPRDYSAVPGDTALHETGQSYPVGVTGLEPVTSSV